MAENQGSGDLTTIRVPVGGRQGTATATPQPTPTGTTTTGAPAAPFGPAAQTGQVTFGPVPTGGAEGDQYFVRTVERNRPKYGGVSRSWERRSISEELQNFLTGIYSSQRDARTQGIMTSLVQAGRVRPNSSPMAFVNAYRGLLEQSAASFNPSTGQALTPSQILMVDMEFANAAASASRRPTTERAFTVFTDQQAQQYAQDSYVAAFGRKPSKAEVNQYVRALRNAAKNAPRVIRYNPDGTRYETSGFNFEQWNQGFLSAKMPTEDDLGGTFGVAQDEMERLLTEYGMDVSEDFRWDMLRRIGEGTATLETAREQVKDLAKIRYKAIAEQIDRGLTVQQVADPYIRNVNRILERANASVTDPLVKQALNFTDDKGNARLMSDGEFEELLRSQPEWAKTVNAKEEAISLADSVLQQMGFGA